MSVLTKVLHQVDPQARKEGGKIRAHGDVRIIAHDDDAISASVFGGQSFGVVLAREGGEVTYSCECKDFHESLDPCKHVWATFVEAEALGYLASWERRGGIELVPYEQEDARWIDDEEDEPIEPSDDDAPVRKGYPAQSVKRIDWKRGFSALRQSMASTPAITGRTWPPQKQLLYVVDAVQTMSGNGLTIELMTREPKKNGELSKPKRETIGIDDVEVVPDPADRELIAMLSGARAEQYGGIYYGYSYNSGNKTSRYRLFPAQYILMMQRMCATGRCFIRPPSGGDELMPITWDEQALWRFHVKIERDEAAKKFIVQGELRNGDQRLALAAPLMMLPGGLIFNRDGKAARLDDGGAYAWMSMLYSNPKIEVPINAAEEFLEQLLTLPQIPNLELPQELTYERTKATPRPRLLIRKPKQRMWSYEKPRLAAELSFDYEGKIVSSTDDSAGIYQTQTRRFIERDRDAENRAAGRLRSVGLRDPRSSYYYEDRPQFEVPATQLPAIIRTLTLEGWHIEADGQLYRQAGEVRVEVSSGIDWFELHGTADFGDQKVALPELLRALQRGEKTVRLDDGTFGVVPEEWLQKYGLLAGMGKTEDDHIKFGKSQVGLLDALLAAQPQITCDAVFQQARDRLLNFQGVRVADPPATFVGTLRPYQREGLGWLGFLRDFSFGGCLADDMGLGKTVQVLAMLEERRLLRVEHASSNGNGASRRPGPTMVVAPRSLIFNWMEEAKRFSPQLRVLDHTGTGRGKSAEAFANFDVVLTTYGTMRNDIAFLKDIRFDYIVLDEAQAIKNANSEAAKASRLLTADHRLALSGTPVQNHLGELWSLFEFLNPGMLGSAKVLQMTSSASKQIDEPTRLLLSRALRPFILRRTKGQVAKELPLRVEQTIHCELDTAQRKQYDELREHYRQSLMSRIAKEGLNKSKIQILEALLRLRQAACHPGLLDKSKVDEGSAKVDSLLAQLDEVMDGDHKALVFSQFTSLLAIVRRKLDANGVKYEYLDGRTRDRQAAVDRFQTDASCKLFLVSLKAGGVGLNLTAAEYVFLLDPWWNPAVEAQAIDRAHRIGQTRQVFAYRLIAKDTVEEKVLKLQESKRELADAIINADNSVIGKLGRDDLELLLS